MATKIRLARGGSKKRPHYSIVLSDSRMPRDGRFLEKLGTYNPMLAKDDEKHRQQLMIEIYYVYVRKTEQSLAKKYHLNFFFRMVND